MSDYAIDDARADFVAQWSNLEAPDCFAEIGDVFHDFCEAMRVPASMRNALWRDVTYDIGAAIPCQCPDCLDRGAA